MEPIAFDGQVAIVTGAGNGLGRCDALELARCGARVVVGVTKEGGGQTSDAVASCDAVAAPDATERTVAAEAPAGTALVFDDHVWHGTGQYTTVDRRHGILAHHDKPGICRQESSAASLTPEVRATASPALCRLAGLDLYSSLGMINGTGSPMDLVPKASCRATSPAVSRCAR